MAQEVPVKHKRLSRQAALIWVIAAAVVLAIAAAAFAQPDEPAAKKEETPKMSILELLLKGRYFMIPIGLCSLLGLAIIIERAISLRRGAIIPPGFMDNLKSTFRHSGEDRRTGLEYCRSNDCPVARVAAAGIRKLHKDEESVEQAIEDAGANEVAKLRRNLRMLFGVWGQDRPCEVVEER